MVSIKISGGNLQTASMPKAIEPKLCPSKVKCGYFPASIQCRCFKYTNDMCSTSSEMLNTFFAFCRIELGVASISPV